MTNLTSSSSGFSLFSLGTKRAGQVKQAPRPRGRGCHLGRRQMVGRAVRLRCRITCRRFFMNSGFKPRLETQALKRPRKRGNLKL